MRWNSSQSSCDTRTNENVVTRKPGDGVSWGLSFEAANEDDRRSAPLQILFASHSRIRAIISPLILICTQTPATENSKLIIIFHFSAAQCAIDFFATDKTRTATICFAIYSIYATEKSMHYRTIAGQRDCNEFFRHTKCMWGAAPAQIFHSKCSRSAMRDHYCRFCWIIIFSHLSPQILRQLPYFARPVCDCATDRQKRNDRKIHIVHARTANSCHAVKLLTIIIINFYWIFFFRLAASCLLLRFVAQPRMEWRILMTERCSAEKWQTAAQRMLFIRCIVADDQRTNDNDEWSAREEEDEGQKKRQFELFVSATKLFEAFNS